MLYDVGSLVAVVSSDSRDVSWSRGVEVLVVVAVRVMG